MRLDCFAAWGGAVWGMRELQQHSGESMNATEAAELYPRKWGKRVYQDIHTHTLSV